MAGEACLASKAYFPWTPGSMSVCLNIHDFVFGYIDSSFSKYGFGIWTADSFQAKYL